MAEKYPLNVQNVGDDTYCFMSKGHHDADAFMAAVAEWCADAPLSPPKHKWVKAIPCRCGEHSCHYELSDEPRKGWFPATYTWEDYGPTAYKPPAAAGVKVVAPSVPDGAKP
ncbi:MAG TPA: hypothetical protein VEA40_00590 [Ramlibacter sp.]|nr:hypothetical protein [Ramlibacter sp.]